MSTCQPSRALNVPRARCKLCNGRRVIVWDTLAQIVPCPYCNQDGPRPASGRSDDFSSVALAVAA